MRLAIKLTRNIRGNIPRAGNTITSTAHTIVLITTIFNFKWTQSPVFAVQ